MGHVGICRPSVTGRRWEIHHSSLSYQELEDSESSSFISLLGGGALLYSRLDTHASFYLLLSQITLLCSLHLRYYISDNRVFCWSIKVFVDNQKY